MRSIQHFLLFISLVSLCAGPAYAKIGKSFFRSCNTLLKSFFYKEEKDFSLPIEEAIFDNPLPSPPKPEVWVLKSLPDSIRQEIASGKRPSPMMLLNSNAHEFIAVRADPNSNGYLWKFRVREGTTEKWGKHIPIVESDEAGFEGANLLMEFIPQRREWFQRLGFSLHEDGSVEIPDMTALNERIIQMRKTSPDEAPCINFYYFIQPHDKIHAEISRMEYLRNWARGRIVVGLKTHELLHDMQVHMLGFLLLPRDVVRLSRIRAKILFDLWNQFQNNSKFIEELRKEIEGDVSTIDNLTSELRGALGDPARYAKKSFKQQPIADLMRWIADPTKYYKNRPLNSLLDMLGSQDRKAAKEIIQRYGSLQDISEERAKEIERDLKSKFPKFTKSKSNLTTDL